MKSEDMTCPFCHASGMDLEGLQYHLQDYCEVFGKLPYITDQAIEHHRKVERGIK